MLNEQIERIENLISVCMTSDDKIAEFLGIPVDELLDEGALVMLTKAINDIVDKTEEGFEYFWHRLSKMEPGPLKMTLVQILAFTSRFDKMKECLDNAEEYGIKGDTTSIDAIMIRLAQSSNYKSFVKELISDKSKLEKYYENFSEIYVVPLLIAIGDTTYIDSFIRKNAKEQAKYEDADSESIDKTSFYGIQSSDYVKIIGKTKNLEYIKKCYLDQELCDLLRLSDDDRLELAFATNDSRIITECIQRSRNVSGQSDLMNYLGKISNKALLLDIITNPEKYGVDSAYIPKLINRAKIPVDELKEIPFFDSDEGKVALALYSNDSSIYESNYKMAERKISLPEDMTIGIEIECTGVYSHLIHNTKALGSWKAKNDCSIRNNDGEPIGIEVVSEVLTGNTEETTKKIVAAMETLKAMGQYSNVSCGGHVHIGAHTLKSEQAYRNLLELWANNEKILLLICNEAGELPRETIFEYASPVSKELEENDAFVQLNEENDLDKFKDKLVTEQRSRYKCINFKNICFGGINTVEFRGSNEPKTALGMIDNINLYGGLVKVSQELAEIQAKEPGNRTPEEKEKLAIFDRLGTDENLLEAERAELLIQLVIEDEKLRPVYRNRYKVNRELLNQHPLLENMMDQDMSHTLIRYSDKNSIGKAVFVGENPITGEEMESVNGLINAAIRTDPNCEFPNGH